VIDLVVWRLGPGVLSCEGFWWLQVCNSLFHGRKVIWFVLGWVMATDQDRRFLFVCFHTKLFKKKKGFVEMKSIKFMVEKHW